TRPSYTAGDALVTLTATIKKGSVEETKTFTLTVTTLAQTDAEAVAAAKDVLTVGYATGDTAADVRRNLTLSTAGLDGTSITWSSDKSSIVAANGTVTRPSYSAGDALVTLTATITKGSTSETKTFVLTVPALPYVPSPSQPSEPSQPVESTEKGFEVWINGKAESVGKDATSARNDQSVLTITLDPNKLAAKLQAAEQGTVITIPVNDASDVIVGQLNGQMISQMADKQAVLVLQTGQASYTLPSVEIDIQAIVKQLGVTDLNQINVQIEIAKPTAETAELVKDAAADGGFALVLKPMQFTVRAQHDDRSIELSQFNSYIERTIAIPEGVDPNKITTAVVVEADGTTRHVPTKIVQQGGRYYAVINSLTNSTYALIVHPVQFKDVEGLAAQDAINDLGSRMIVQGSGKGLYEPRKSITRAEFIAIIVRALGLEQINGVSPFSDVKQSAWYNGAVNAAYAYHLIDGLGDGQFHAQDVITREQAMVIIARAMTLTKLTETISAQSADTALKPYSDAGNVSIWAEQSIMLCLQAGLVNGKSSKLLAPKDHITKAEVAIIIERLLQQSELINKQ
ncbi:S-layer homology domain-containing protein, partial [Paenibacillus sp. CCS19]|uniref:S-layer homology domain-containing protein n=1 Tax=Paenibacillus sp. CCS19 TaxID=3158387 RepID=UPI00295F1B07